MKFRRYYWLVLNWYHQQRIIYSNDNIKRELEEVKNENNRLQHDLEQSNNELANLTGCHANCGNEINEVLYYTKFFIQELQYSVYMIWIV